MFNPFKKIAKAAVKTATKNASKASSVTKNKIVTSGKGAVPISKKQAVVDKMKYASPSSPTVGKYQNKMYASGKELGTKQGRLQGMAIGAGAAGAGAAIASGNSNSKPQAAAAKPVAKAPVKSVAKPAAPAKSASRNTPSGYYPPAKKTAPISGSVIDKKTKRKLKF